MIALDTQRIAVLADAEDDRLHGYLKGIRDYARDRVGWELFGVGLPCYREIEDLRSWEGDGCLLATDLHDATAEALMESSRHAVVVGRAEEGVPSVTFDAESRVKVAALHFVEQGVRQFAFHGRGGHGYERSIAELARGMGVPFEVVRRAALRSCLAGLQGSLGVFVADCAAAVEVIREATVAGAAVPADVAVVSLGDDKNCALATPSLSSVPFPARRLGYRAARLLDQQLNGEQVPGVVAVGADKVAVRKSSSRRQYSDPLVHGALRHIHKTVDRSPLRVVDLANAFRVSRAHLTHRFQEVVGKPPADIIRQTRLNAAMRFLRQPGQMVKSVAYTMGFSSSQEFARFFKNASGRTPSEYARSAAPATD